MFPTGQTASASFNAARDSTNSAFNILNPSIGGTLGFSILQPLLQNRNGIQFKGPLQIAKTQLAITSKQTEATIAGIVANAAGQYWDAVRARDNVKVLQQTLDLALKSYERDKQALDLGALAGLDIYQSQTQVCAAPRDRSGAGAVFVRGPALDGLRRLMGADVTPDFRALEIVLEDDPAQLPEPHMMIPYEAAYRGRVAPNFSQMDVAQNRLTIDDRTRASRAQSDIAALDATIAGTIGKRAATGWRWSVRWGIISPAVSKLPDRTLGQVSVSTRPGMERDCR